MITFTKQPPTDKLIASHNNSIMEFTSSLTNPLYATISNDFNSTIIKIFPSPLGVFWANLKPLYKSFFELKDEINIDLGTSPNITFVDADLWKEVEFTVTVYNSTTNESTTTTLEIILQSLQDKEPYLTKDFQFISNNFTTFKGYPYSIDFYVPNHINGNSFIGSFFETNYSLIFQKGINRFFLNDGTVDGGDVQRLAFLNREYFGAISVLLDFTEFPVKAIFDQIITYPYCNGTYLKWLSNNGWKYWLFGNKHREVRETKSLGQIENDFNIPEESISPVKELGKRSISKKKLHATFVRDEDRDHVNSILESPKIFMFTGTPNQTATLNDWLEVELLTSSIVHNDYDRTKSNLEFEIKTRRNTISML